MKSCEMAKNPILVTNCKIIKGHLFIENLMQIGKEKSNGGLQKPTEWQGQSKARQMQRKSPTPKIVITFNNTLSKSINIHNKVLRV